jgi:4-amino-4-deoxy-L-arabinose transferase-like glycosyltransferase
MALYHISALPLDLHLWRQTQTLSTARNFLFGHWNILMPEIDSNYNQPFVLLEFPIYQFVLALLWKVFGFSYEIGRLFSISLIVAASWMTGKIAENFLERPLKFFSHTLLALPFVVFWSRTFMIDTMVLFAVVGTVYALLEIDRKKSLKALPLFFLMLALLLLIKPNIAIIPFCLCLYFFLSRASLRQHWAALSLTVLAALSLGLGWFIHAKAVNLSNPHVYTNMALDWFWGKPEQLKDPWSLGVIFWRFVINCSGWAFFICSLLGCILSRRRVLYLTCILSCLLYLLAAPNLNLVHSYYQLPLSFPIALVIIVGLEEASQHWSPRWATVSAFGVKLTLSLFCLWVLRMGWFEFGFVGPYSPYSLKQENEVVEQVNRYFEERQINNKTALVQYVAICDLRPGPWDPHSLLFLTNTRGTFVNNLDCPAFLAQNPSGYDYIFVLKGREAPLDLNLAAIDGQRRILIQQ